MTRNRKIKTTWPEWWGSFPFFGNSHLFRIFGRGLLVFPLAALGWTALPAPARAEVATNAPVSTNAVTGGAEPISALQMRLEQARRQRALRQTNDLESQFVSLLGSDCPASIQQSALLELAGLAKDNDQAARAQDIYSQFLIRWPNDERAPEVMLRQGQLFRQMGLNNLALAKFYAVMTTALGSKNDRLEYFQKIVLQAQVEIADTHYQLGRYEEAADLFLRLLKLEDASVERPLILYKLIRSYAASGHEAEAASFAENYLAKYPEGPEEPEVRFHLASSLKKLGHDNESLQQVLALLREQRDRTRERPADWAYWQERTGNLIANQLYREADYSKALDIYLSLVQLDASPAWQWPVNYQVGMTYERLRQPQKAIETYAGIVSGRKGAETNVPPSLQAVLDMAQWRINYLRWQDKAEAIQPALGEGEAPTTPVAANLPVKNNYETTR